MKSTKSYSLVLGSSSVYRQAQLRQLTKNFTVINPDIDEASQHNESAKELAPRLSKSKALASYSKIKTNLHLNKKQTNQTVIICSDQTAALGSLILGKPHTKKAAVEQLQQCSGKTVVFHSAVSILNFPSKFFMNSKTDQDYDIDTQVVDTEVKFRTLEKNEIIRYVDRDEPLNCAGSFKCESLGIALFDSITSADPSALIGLPLISVSRMLRDIGIDVID